MRFGYASSADMVEIRSVLLVLQWASEHGIPEVRIHTDSTNFVQGLPDPFRS